MIIMTIMIMPMFYKWECKNINIEDKKIIMIAVSLSALILQCILNTAHCRKIALDIVTVIIIMFSTVFYCSFCLLAIVPSPNPNPCHYFYKPSSFYEHTGYRFFAPWQRNVQTLFLQSSVKINNNHCACFCISRSDHTLAADPHFL